MSGPAAPLRIVTLSPIDYERAPNNRDHNLVRVLAARGCEVTHVYQALNRSARPLDLLRDTLTASVRARTERGLRLVRVDPFFNYYAGLRARSDHARGRPGRGLDRSNATPGVREGLARAADLVFSVGHRLGELRRRQGARTVHVIPNGVAWEHFERARGSAQRDRTLFYTGNIVPWSGLERVLRALPELRAEFPDLRLRV